MRWLWAPVLILFVAFAYMNCGPSSSSTFDTVTGNPLVEFSVETYNSSISELEVCLAAIEFVPLGGGAPVVVDFTDYGVTLSKFGALLEKQTVPAGTYQRVDLRASNTCGSGYSVMVSNMNGTYRAQSEVRLSFAGTFEAKAPDKKLSMKIAPIVAQLETANSDASVATAASSVSGSFDVETPGQNVILDDFAFMRKNRIFTNLWQAQTHSPQTVNVNNGELSAAAISAPGVGISFFPYASGYKFPTGYAQFFGKAGTWDPDFNRLRFKMNCVNAVPRRADGGSILDFNAFVRKHDDPSDAYAGYQYIHTLNPNMYAGRWMNVQINRLAQSYFGAAPALQPELDAEFARSGAHHFDGLTRFEIVSASGGGWNGNNCKFDDFTFARVAQEPDASVGAVTSVYSGSAYEVTWATPKNRTVTYEVRYSTQSLKVIGFGSGTDGGTVTNSGTALSNVVWTGPGMALAPKFYIGIRPQGETVFTEVSVP
ncbi:MAG: hypothetical protein ABL958_06515 [Bdellovibrionia bacterium]